MKYAIISDIHGNSIALDAVLKAIESDGGVDSYLFLGDHTAIGHDPIGVLERVHALPNATLIRGNVDRYMFTERFPAPDVFAIQRNPQFAQLSLEVSCSFAWTQGMITAAGWFERLAALPLERRFVLPDGTRVLMVHASPGCDDGTGIHPTHDDGYVERLFGDCGAELVLVGHTHWPQERRLPDVHVVNPGSVSNNFPPDLRACYAILEADESGYSITFHRADYDREAVVTQLEQLKHPARQYIIDFMHGNNRPNWWDAYVAQGKSN